jgi:hypothetical protein
MEDVVLPERPTLVVGDLRGALPIHRGTVPAWNAALAAMAPGGRTIPLRDVLLVQPVRSPTLRSEVVAPAAVEGVALEPLAPALRSLLLDAPDDAEDVADPAEAFAVEWSRPLSVEGLRGTAVFSSKADREIDGFRVGLEADLGHGVRYRSFGPGRARAYGSYVLPCPRTLRPSAGEEVALEVVFDVADRDVAYRWRVALGSRTFEWQGTAVENPGSLDALRAGSPDHVPGADPSDPVEAALRTRFGSGRTIAQIVEDALRDLPADTPRSAVEDRAVALSRERESRRVRRL